MSTWLKRSQRLKAAQSAQSLMMEKEEAGSKGKKDEAKAKMEQVAEHQALPNLVFDPYNIKIEGEKFPDVIPVFIEVASGSRNKYEWDQTLGCLTLDRVLHSAVHYPNDYGFIPQTLCGDGDPLDVLVMGTAPLIPGCVVYARPLAYMIMEDEKGMDEKVLAVLENDPNYRDFQEMTDIPKHKMDEISHFFESYKKLEKNKWAKIGGWHAKEETLKLIKDTHKTFMDKI